MRLDDIDPSGNINDQGATGGGFGGGGGGMLGLLFGLLPMLLGRKMGCGTLLVIAVVGYFFFSNSNFLASSGAAPETQQGSGSATPCDNQSELLACRVFTSSEQTWKQLLPNYQPASLNFYQGGGRSGCGEAQAAMGPFYCPSDRGIYLDAGFFQQMEQQAFVRVVR